MFGKQQATGPARGPGHYSEDGRWWWDQGQHRWFRVTGQEDVLEVEAEDVGGTSLVASLLAPWPVSTVTATSGSSAGPAAPTRAGPPTR